MFENSKSNKLTQDEIDKLLETLRTRFDKNMSRHEEIKWEAVEGKLQNSPDKLFSLFKMEETGGEPDIVDYDFEKDEYIFYDCSKESPKGRRSICYDQEALDKRKEHKPIDSAVNMAYNMGIELLDEVEYSYLQSLGDFDLKTSSWIKTPEKIRKLGGAIFCDRRYDTVFLYHNGADSYYSSRGFRGVLRV